MQWTLTNPSDSATYAFDVNPNKASIQTAREAGQAAPIATGGHSYLSARQRTPRTMSVGGVVRSQEQYEELEAWSSLGVRLDMTDHLGRSYVVRIEGFQPTMQAPTHRSAPWRHTYTMTIVIYSGPVSA